MVIRLFKRFGLIAFAGCLTIAVAQSPAVVFTNLTTLVNNRGCQVNGANFGPQTCAAQFTSSGNFTLADAKISAVALPSGGGSFNIWIAADAGNTPGAFIEQIGFNLTATSTSGSVVTANTIATPVTLTSGTKYWLVATPATAQTSFLWGGGAAAAVPVATNSSATFNSGWTVSTFDLQFQIDGIATSGGPTTPPGVPLPPSVILTLTGLASAGLYRLRRTRRS